MRRSVSQDIKLTFFWVSISFLLLHISAFWSCHSNTLAWMEPLSRAGAAVSPLSCHAQKQNTKLICTSVEILQSFPSCYISALGHCTAGEWQLFSRLALLWRRYLFQYSLHLAFLFVPLVWVIALIWISRLTPCLTLFYSLRYCLWHPAFLLVVLIKNYSSLTTHFYIKFISKNNMHACMYVYVPQDLTFGFQYSLLCVYIRNGFLKNRNLFSIDLWK